MHLLIAEHVAWFNWTLPCLLSSSYFDEGIHKFLSIKKLCWKFMFKAFLIKLENSTRQRKRKLDLSHENAGKSIIFKTRSTAATVGCKLYFNVCWFLQATPSWWHGWQLSWWLWCMSACPTRSATLHFPTSSSTMFRTSVGLFGHAKWPVRCCLLFGFACWCFINIGELIDCCLRSDFYSFIFFFRLILLRRFFALGGTVFLLRCFTMLITSLSVPGSHLECRASDFKFDDGDRWDCANYSAN